MDIQLAKYKEPIAQQLEELTAEDVLGQSAQKTVELNQQSLGRVLSDKTNLRRGGLFRSLSV
jgi:DnaK suppressor protein